ncbi:MAG: PAS domain S-box protein, partial [Actinomycetota bacterium]
MKRRSAGLSIRRLVSLFVLLTTVPLALLTGLTLNVGSDALYREVEARVASTAAVGAVAIRNEMQGLRELVESYAKRTPLAGALADSADYDHDSIRRHLTELQQASPGIATAFLAMPDGRLIDIVPVTPSIIGKDFSFRDWYRGVIASGHSYISEAYVSQATGHPQVVAVATMVFAPPASQTPGELLAILVAAYGRDTIQRFVDDFASSQGVSFAVTDQRGVLLAAPMTSSGKLVSRARDPQVAAALRGDSGSATEDTPAGSVLSAYQPVFGLGWTINASVPERDALKAVGTLRTTLLTVAALLGVVLVSGLILLVRALRDRNRTEEALQASEERTRSIIETASDALIGMDTDGLITDWNPQAEVTFGWSREEVIGRSVADTVIPARFRKAHWEGLERFLATGEGPVLGRRIELSALHRDGHEFPVELSVNPIRLGQALSFNAFVHDISERQQAEEALRESEETLRAVFAASPDIFTTVGPNGELGPPSPAVHQVLGYSPEEYASLDRIGIVHPEDRERALDALQTLLQAGSALEIRFRVKHADGHWVTLEARGQAITDDEGKNRGAVMASRDVTERVALEEALRQAKEDAERANRAKSEFLSRMSHELRTPLNAVLGFGQLLELDHLTAEQLESVQQILKGGKHLLDLINEVLDIARIETGRIALSLEPVHIQEALSGAIDLVRPIARERGLQIETHVPETDHLYVFADRQRLKQVLLNLLSNAVKYNREGGSVIVRSEVVEGEALRVSVSDQGAGIPFEKMDRLFTPFDRLGAEGTGVEGTGLGLALSKRLAEAMGGTMAVKSTPGQGSTFSVDLPLSESPEQHFERAGAPVSALPPLPEGSHRLLYIEDNPANVKLIERVLEGFPGVTVLSAPQGRLGLELARQHRPDVILLDL